MNDKELEKYSEWLWGDITKQVAVAAVIYVVALGAYWLLVG